MFPPKQEINPTTTKKREKWKKFRNQSNRSKSNYLPVDRNSAKSVIMEGEGELKKRLEELQKQLGKKQLFEDSVSNIRSLLRQSYPSASPSLRNSFHTVITRVATILKTRYTAPGFWNAGLGLFLEAEQLVSDSSQREHLQSFITKAREHMSDVENQPEESAESQRNGYLFEGHLTVDREPPPPRWLVQSNMLTAMMASMSQGESSQVNAPSILEVLADSQANAPEGSDALLEDLISMISEDAPGPQRAPPASKEVVGKLPVVSVTEEILVKLGSAKSCAICMENLVVGDDMQELPCMHKFHPLCIKPWLDDTNSCPTCRHELPTEDPEYDRRREREKEAEEERKGAANAVRGGEYMYV